MLNVKCWMLNDGCCILESEYRVEEKVYKAMTVCQGLYCVEVRTLVRGEKDGRELGGAAQC